MLTTELGLNRSTIGDLTAELESMGLVTRGACRSSARRSGRPSLVVTACPEVSVVAVAVDVDRIAVALVGLGGVVLERRVRGHQRGRARRRRTSWSGRADGREVLGRTPTALGASASASRSREPSGAADGLVRFAPNLGWVDEPFADLLAAALDLPVVVGNDADLGVLAEHLRGAAVG